jgi:glycosyltransferase involved in cell wall biosynthesis
MDILFCNYEYPPIGGGGGVVNAALARELARSHNVTVLTSRAFGLPADAVEGGVRVIRTPVLFRRQPAAANFPSMAAYLASGTWCGRALLKRQHFDVINTHFALPTGPVGYVLGRFAGVPNVLSVHGGDLYDPSKKSSAHRHALLRLCVRHLALSAEAVVAQSQDTSANLHRYFAPEVEAAIIPLGIPRPPPLHASRAAYGFSPDDKLLITVGRLVSRKAVDQLIDLVAELRDPHVKLLVLGSGPLAAKLQERAQHREVTAQVRFLGYVDEQVKYELLSLADIYVSTSQHEGFGLVFLEAMAAGLPIVCYDTGGQCDFLQDGHSGHVVALNDCGSFTARCRELLGRPELSAACGSANRRAVEQYYIDECARQYAVLFESVIQGRYAVVPPARRAGAQQAGRAARNEAGVVLSVIVPLYNERQNVAPLAQAIVQALTPLDLRFEVLLVDDGSTDGTFEHASALSAEYAQIRVIRLRRNFGQTAAMAAGIEHARGAVLVTMDGDLQNDPSDIPMFLDKLDEGYDLVVGWRYGRKDKLLTRKIPSKAANWLIGKITGVPIKDNGCSLKAYRADLIKKIPLYSELHRFIPAMASLAGPRIAEVKVRHHARRFGRSKYGLSRIYRVLLDLLAVKTIIGFASRPLTWFLSLAVPALLVSAACLAVSFYETVLLGEPFSTTVAGVGVLFGALAFFLIMAGMFGELVYKTADYRVERLSMLTAQYPSRHGSPSDTRVQGA